MINESYDWECQLTLVMRSVTVQYEAKHLHRLAVERREVDSTKNLSGDREGEKRGAASSFVHKNRTLILNHNNGRRLTSNYRPGEQRGGVERKMYQWKETFSAEEKRIKIAFDMKSKIAVE